jgi:hypothetical protein
VELACVAGEEWGGSTPSHLVEEMKNVDACANNVDSIKSSPVKSVANVDYPDRKTGTMIWNDADRRLLRLTRTLPDRSLSGENG